MFARLQSLDGPLMVSAYMQGVVYRINFWMRDNLLVAVDYNRNVMLLCKGFCSTPVPCSDNVDTRTWFDPAWRNQCIGSNPGGAQCSKSDNLVSPYPGTVYLIQYYPGTVYSIQLSGDSLLNSNEVRKPVPKFRKFAEGFEELEASL